MEFEGFLIYLRTEKRASDYTTESYGSDLAQFDAFCKREYDIQNAEEVSQTIVRSWMAQLLEEKYQPSSVHRKLSSINAYYRFLAKTNAVKLNPARGITKPKLPGRLPVFVDEKSTKALYESNSTQNPNEVETDFSSIRNRLIVTLLYETGIRRAELLNLKDNDIDSYKGQIKVLGKRNKMRFVPIGNEMKEKIKHYQITRTQTIPHLQTDHLFVTDQGKKISKTFVYLTVKAYLSQVSTIKRKSPHVLRHTFATHMLNNGADLNVIKEILGHSSLAATQVYTHNSIEKLKSIHKKMHPRNN